MAPLLRAELIRRWAPIALFLLAAPVAFAVIGLTPMQLDVYARPGIPEPFEISVTNTTDTQRSVRLVVAAVRIDEDGNTEIVEDRGEDGADAGFDSAPGGPGAAGPDVRSLVAFEGGPLLTLAPKEQRQVVCMATLPPGTITEHLAWVMADPGPEEMPGYGNTNLRLQVIFRIAARVLIVPGLRRQRRDADGNMTVTVERYLRPTYSVRLADVAHVVPAVDVEDGVLRVEGLLDNQSNTYITPMIQAELRNVSTRRIVEDVVLGHGLSFVMGQTTRRFSGHFTSPLDPGQYEVTVEVDLGDGRPADMARVPFELTDPVPGRTRADQGVLTLEPAKVRVTVRPGDRSSGEVTITNNFDETLRVTPYPGSTSYADWFTFSPKSLVLHPGRSRTGRVAIRAPRDAPQDLQEVLVTFVPTTVNGSTFPEGEAQTMGVTLRVLAPRASSDPRDR